MGDPALVCLLTWALNKWIPTEWEGVFLACSSLGCFWSGTSLPSQGKRDLWLCCFGEATLQGLARSECTNLRGLTAHHPQLSAVGLLHSLPDPPSSHESPSHPSPQELWVLTVGLSDHWGVLSPLFTENASTCCYGNLEATRSSGEPSATP